MKKTIKIIIITLAILTALFTAFYFMGQDKDVNNGSKLSSSNTVDGIDASNTKEDESRKDTDFLETLGYIKSMQIDASIFLNSSFRSLKDNSVVIDSDGIVGRANPFSPVFGVNQSLPESSGSIQASTSGDLN